MCFRLCLTSFVWHSIFSVVAFCLLLNFLNIFLIILRSFQEKEVSPFLITFIRNIWIPLFFYAVCGIRLFNFLAALGLSCGLWHTVPWLGIESQLLLGECTVLAPGPPGNSWIFIFLFAVSLFPFNHLTLSFVSGLTICQATWVSRVYQ